MSGIDQLITPIHGNLDERFEPVKFIGKGSYGFVELCKDRQNEDRLICRKVARIVETTESEILTLYRSKHTNIIRFYGYYRTRVDQSMIDRSNIDGEPMGLPVGTEVYCLMIEFGECGDLEKYIRERKSIEEIILVKLIYQVVQALQYLNLNNNIHRDIKPENILLDKYGNAKLADFGTVFQMEKNDSYKQHTNVQGTTIYIAPEMYFPHKYESKYDYLVDIFSLGVVIYRACNSEIGEANLQNLSRTKKPKSIPNQYSQEFNSLLMEMLSLDVAKRASTFTILEVLYQIILPKELNKDQQDIYDKSLKLLNGIDGIYDTNEARDSFEHLCLETKLECPDPVYQLAQCFFYGYGTDKNITQAIRLLRIASRKHHVKSMILLAFCYQYGIGVEKDLFSAIQLLSIVQNHDQEASFLLGHEYYNSSILEMEAKTIGKQSKVAVKRDYELAFHYFLQAKNFPPAQNYLGLCYLNGYGTKKDLFEAYKYFKLSADGGYLDGMFNLAIFYLTQKSDDSFYTEKAIALLTDAADQYHMGAALKLSEIYNNDTIIAQDQKKALYYSKMYSKGSEAYDSSYSYALIKLNGSTNVEKNENEAITRLTTCSENHPGATYQLATYYKNSLKNKEIIHALDDDEEEKEAELKREELRKSTEKKAAELFEKASNNGIIDSMGDFAICLLRGKGCEANAEQALKLLNESSELGSAHSTYLLAKCYLNGEGVTEDKVKAVQLLRTAHSGGCISATYLLAHCLHQFEGVGPEGYSGETLEQSRELFDIAVKKGHATAAYELGMIYNQNGEIFAYKQKAATLFEIAANQNYPQAITELGILYETGSGVQKDGQKAFKLYRKANKLGDLQSIYHLGMCYLKEIGTEKDVEKGRDLLEQAVSININSAKTQLGILYKDGIGGPKDESKAVELFKQAADNNDVEAKYQLGLCLFDGIGIAADRSKAIRFFVDARKEDHTEASYLLAKIYMYGINARKNIEEAVNIFKHLVNRKKHVPSMYELGKHYVENSNTEKLSKGISLLERAEQNEYPDSFNLLGNCYLKGIGVVLDVKKAISYFYKAIDAGNLHAKVNLGQCYIEGNGLCLNQEKGFRILNEAPQDDPAAKFRIGVCYYKGVGVEHDVEKGIELLKEAVLGDDIDAMCYYGKLLMKGTDVEMNKPEAIKYFRKAAARGQAEAKFQLGRVYEEGIEDVPKDIGQALDLYKESSNAGFPKAYYRLGKHYFNDLNKKKEGIELFEKAADFYDVDALKELARIYSEGDGAPVNQDKADNYLEIAEDPQLYKSKKDMLQSNFEPINKPHNTQPKKPTSKNKFRGYFDFFPNMFGKSKNKKQKGNK